MWLNDAVVPDASRVCCARVCDSSQFAKQINEQCSHARAGAQNCNGIREGIAEGSVAEWSDSRAVFYRVLAGHCFAPQVSAQQLISDAAIALHFSVALRIGVVPTVEAWEKSSLPQ